MIAIQKQPQTPVSPNRLRKFAVAVAILLAAKVFFSILFEYQWYFPADFERSAFLTGRQNTFVGLYRPFFYAHIIVSPFAILFGAFLMLESSRARFRRAHRIVGRIQMAVVLVVSVSGFVMAREAYTGPIAMWGFIALAIATFGSSVFAVVRAIQRRFASHRRWATRCFLLLCSPLLLRVVGGVLMVTENESDWSYRLNAWLSWSIPLAVYEARCRWSSLKRQNTQTAQPSPHKRRMNMRTQTLPANASLDIPNRRGFTLAEVLVVMAILAMLIGLLLPNIRSSRGAARRTQCINNSKNIVLAILNHESAHARLPTVFGAFDEDVPSDSTDFRRLSGIVALLPFMEEHQLWEAIKDPHEIGGVSYPARGSAAFDEEYPHWKYQPMIFLCPSANTSDGPFGQTNYAFCVGDSTTNIHRQDFPRGAFGGTIESNLTLGEVTDGTSQTIAIAEIGTRVSSRTSVIGEFAINQPQSFLDSPAECLATKHASNPHNYATGITVSKLGRGGNWADGSAGYTLFNTVLPPNSPSCAVGGTDAADGIYSAGSPHSSGVSVAMLDGSCRFISLDIDTGDATQSVSADSKESPYGVWGALGTANGAEQTDL